MDLGNRLEIKLRCLASATAIREFELGDDPGLLRLRDRMPEPAGCESGFYRAAASWDMDVYLSRKFGDIAETSFDVVLFERVLVAWMGAVWWAWRHEKSGKIYL